MINPTAEQKQAIEAYLTGEGLRIEALAGSGKTTTLRLLVAAGSPRGGKILYTSFGNKVIKDAKAKFPAKLCRVSTNHALAWGGYGRRYQEANRLQGRLTPHDLISYYDWHSSTFAPNCDLRSGAYGVIETITAFCQSSDPDVRLYHAAAPALRLCRGDKERAQSFTGVLARYARETWSEMMKRGANLPVTHDIYLKEWALSQPVLPYKTIMLDEAQDANPVIVSVLRQQEHAQLVIVGDRRQAIYAFRGAINAMDDFNLAHSTALTQSFRFGPEIADVANAILVDQCASDVLIRGDDNQPGTVGTCHTPHCYLARKNAPLVGALFEIAQRSPGYKIGVVGGVDDLIKLVEGAEQLQMGQYTAHPELTEFTDWNLVREAIEHDAYQHLRKLVGLVESYGTGSLRAELERIRRNEEDPDSCDVLLSTAHKAKGAEFESVKLLDDFIPKGPPRNLGEYGWTPDEGNLLYVAVTRARRHLDVTQCEAVLGSLPTDYVFAATPELDDTGDEMSEAALFPADVEPEEGDGRARVPMAVARICAGTWGHPVINGGTIEVSDAGGGDFRVRVSALGFDLFEARGDFQVLGGGDEGGIRIRIGTGTLQVPPEALELTPL